MRRPMWKEWWQTYGGRLSGALAGGALFIVYKTSGFWDMLFCALLVGTGYWIGKMRDEKREPLIPWERLVDWLESRWPRSR